MMIANFPGAIVVEAAKYGYPRGARNNHPIAWCLHTPEEPPDNNPSTPYYFHNLTDRNASTTYFVAWTGLVFQCVPEDEGAYANGVEGKPYPIWANPNVNLNLQTLSIEIEGYASSIHLTMPRGSPQWVSLVRLIAHRCKELGMKPENTIGHYQVSNQRSDPGQLDIQSLIIDVKSLFKKEEDVARLVRKDGTAHVYVVVGTHLEGLISAQVAGMLGYDLSKVEVLPVDHPMWKLRTVNDNGVATDD
jgi:hypothetical protein